MLKVKLAQSYRHQVTLFFFFVLMLFADLYQKTQNEITFYRLLLEPSLCQNGSLQSHKGVCLHTLCGAKDDVRKIQNLLQVQA